MLGGPRTYDGKYFVEFRCQGSYFNSGTCTGPPASQRLFENDSYETAVHGQSALSNGKMWARFNYFAAFILQQ